MSESAAENEPTTPPEPPTGTEDAGHATDDRHAEIPEHSLRWCFEVLSPSAPETPPFDLLHAPTLAPETLERLKQAIDGIAPMPEIWHQVRDMVQSDEASPKDLARLVEQDPVLTSHVLKWGNSAVYTASAAHKTTDVAHTLARMGMNEAQNLILESLLPQIGKIGRKSSLEAQHVWFHSKAIAMFCRELAAFAGQHTDAHHPDVHPDEPHPDIHHDTHHLDVHHAALNGLLHDIGKLIILHLEDEDTTSRIAEHISAGKPDLQAEWEVLGYTHIDAGMMLALHWHLPREVHRFIYFHHHASWHALDDWPHEMHEPVMLVHASHMLLHGMQDTTSPGGTWAGNVRTRLDESESVLRHGLHIPLADTALYAHLQHELSRLKLVFPELYPPDEEEDGD